MPTPQQAPSPEQPLQRQVVEEFQDDLVAPHNKEALPAPAQKGTLPMQRVKTLSVPEYTQLAWGNQPPPWLCLPAQQKGPHEQEASPEKYGAPTQRKKNITGLPDALKAGVESLSAQSLDDVQVHYNSSKPAEVQALAYTQGTEIYVGPGQEKYLPHEAWHVVQQKQGRVSPTLPSMGVAINNDQSLELEADILGAKAAHGEQGNAFWVQPGAGRKASVSLQRALDQVQIDTLTARAIQLGNRIEQIIARLPTVISNNVRTDNLMDPIRNVTNNVHHHANAVDFDPLNQMLDEAEQAINGLDQVVAAHQANFDAIGRTYNAVPAADRNALFSGFNTAFVRIGRSIEKGATIVTQVDALKRAIEGALIPEKEEMKAMRSQNAQEAMDRVAMIVQAGLAVVGTLNKNNLYASGYDTARDQFGGAWSLKMAASTGKAQWLNEWEFHIHATVQRAALAPNPVTGFIINRAHIKPSAGARELGVSIQITNAALLTQVQNDNQRQIIQWSQTPDGENILRKIKR